MPFDEPLIIAERAFTQLDSEQRARFLLWMIDTFRDTGAQEGSVQFYADGRRAVVSTW